jgi:dsRNA-specific ribonuclease
MSDSAPSSALPLVNPPLDPIAEQELAWTGDAVLALWAREHILRTVGHLDTDTFLRLTANSFLQSFGRPTRVEAEFGLVYREQGLAAAFAYIEARLLPTFARQQANRRRQRR